MADIPDQLKIGYQHVSVIPGKFNLEDDLGAYSDEDAEIHINNTKSNREICNSLLHESMHAVCFTYGLRQDSSAAALEERYVTTLANGLTQIFLDNPTFLQFLRNHLYA